MSRWTLAALSTLCFLSSSLFIEGRVQAAEVTGEISRIGDATHIEFKGKSDWKYDLTRDNPTQVSLTVPAFSEATEVQLRTWSSHFIKKVTIDKKAVNNQYKVTLELADKDVESFDYLTDQPSRLIIDFFKQQPEKKAATSQNKKATLPKKKKLTSAQHSRPSSPLTKGDYTRKSKDRRPAGDELIEVGKFQKAPRSGRLPQKGVYDGADRQFQRFRMKDFEIHEEAIIASQQNIYIRFPMLKMPISRLGVIMSHPPEYVIKPRDDQENKEAQLLLQLYKKKRYSMFLKTYEYFVKKYPDSIYDEMIRNLSAEIYFDLWKKEGKASDLSMSRSIYAYLIKTYPDSVLAERAEKILAYSALERGEGLNTLRRFQLFLQKHSQSNERDQAKKALAEAYLILKKYDEALGVYEDLEKNFAEKVNGVEGRYRMGDVYFAQRSYKKALEAYEDAIAKYPKYKGHFPNALYNMAEADFWLGEYQNSLNRYVDFLQYFPSHDHGGYAMTRVGELLEILGADRQKVMGAFLESYFRFRSSQGAEIARIRMLSQRMKGMKDKEMKKALNEMNRIADSSKLPKMAEFVTLMVSDGLQRRGEYRKALDYLVTYYQKHPTSTNISVFRRRILANIADQLKSHVTENNFIEALKTYSEYSTTWLRNVDRIDIPYMLANAYEQAGAYSAAEKIYRHTLSRLLKIEGTKEGKERRVNEHLPTLGLLKLRLATVAYHERDYQKALDQIDKIKNPELLSSSAQVERVDLLGQIYEAKGQNEQAKKALSTLLDTWKDDKAMLSPIYLRMAGLHYKLKEYDQALSFVDKVEVKESENETKLIDMTLRKLRLKGQILLRLGQKMAAVQVFTELLEKEEGKASLSSIRYKVGKILFDEGDIKGAEKIWNQLDSKKSQLYKQLANEEMTHAKWQDEYKKYINRIPAAVNLK